MGFYEKLSRYYDEIFPSTPEDMFFINKLIGGRKAILDIGCGTGNKTALLVDQGRRVHAFDLSESMISSARINHAGAGITYDVLDMNDIGEYYKNMRFDAALCLGNTLVHLEDIERISSFFTQLRSLLTPDAVFILQILNYDRILDNKITGLPVLEGDHTVFTRHYAHMADKLIFNTSITVKETGERFDSAVPLTPIRKSELGKMLQETGFGSIDYYGNYDGDPFTADSFALIAACRAV